MDHQTTSKTAKREMLLLMSNSPRTPGSDAEKATSSCVGDLFLNLGEEKKPPNINSSEKMLLLQNRFSLVMKERVGIETRKPSFASPGPGRSRKKKKGNQPNRNER
jgi:hypothetical protein